MAPDIVLESKKSEFQQIDIVEFSGEKALILDGFLQVYTRDEFIYHEMLGHFPLSHHPNPERVLVLGAGDGFLLRELLKYDSVREIVLVDIDKDVVELSKKHFSKENGNSLDDERVKVIVADALKYADECKEQFDVVIMDLIAYESGAELYTNETVEKFIRLMKEDGVFATHGDDSSAPNYIGVKLFSMISKHFKDSKAAGIYIPSFDSLWTFMVFSNKELSICNPEDPETKFFERNRDYSYPPFLKDKLKHFNENGFEKFVSTKYRTKRITLDQSFESVLR
jgi:spermidine synthase